MFNSSPAPAPSTPESVEVNPLRKLWWGLGFLGVLLLGLYLFLPRGRGTTEQKTASTGAEWNSARCDRVLTDAYRSLAPERLGVTSGEDSTLRDLNQWAERCGKSSEGNWDTKALASILPAETLPSVESPRFLRRDAFHVRMCRTARELVLRLVPQVRSDAERAAVLFDYVIRQVELRPAEMSNPPLFSPYDCLVYGEGTAAERAWLFVELLRQVPLDAVVFTSDDPSLGEHPLVGVLTPDQGCLLYDCTLGLPIPAALNEDAAPLFSKAATWKAATASDDLFRQLDAGDLKHPWSAEKLKAATVGLVGTSSWWSPRMARLQFQLQPIAGNNVMLSEPLLDVGKDQPGYQTRVANYSAGETRFEKDRVRVWSFPETHLEGGASSAPSPYAAALQRVFNGPTVVQVKTVNNQREQGEGPSNRPLKLIRVWQILGNEETLRGYLAIRNAPSEIPSGENNAAAQFATYWVGLAQFEQGSFGAAQETWTDYLKVNAQALRGEAAVRMIAESLAVEKKPEAIAILSRVKSPATPLRNAVLLKHWKRLFVPSESESAKPAESFEEKPKSNGE